MKTALIIDIFYERLMVQPLYRNRMTENEHRLRLQFLRKVISLYDSLSNYDYCITKVIAENSVKTNLGGILLVDYYSLHNSSNKRDNNHKIPAQFASKITKFRNNIIISQNFAKNTVDFVIVSLNFVIISLNFAIMRNLTPESASHTPQFAPSRQSPYLYTSLPNPTRSEIRTWSFSF